MLVRRRDCDCLLLAWLAASGGLARHRLSDTSAPFIPPFAIHIPLSPHRRRRNPSTPLPVFYLPYSLPCTHTHVPIYIAIRFSFPLYPIFLCFIRPVRSCSPLSTSLSHTYDHPIHSVLRSSPCLTFRIGPISSFDTGLSRFSLSTTYRATMHPLANSKPCVARLFLSPPPVYHRLRSIPLFYLFRSYVRTIVTHTVATPLFLSSIIAYLPSSCFSRLRGARIPSPA